jgi:hypothetical protein
VIGGALVSRRQGGGRRHLGRWMRGALFIIAHHVSVHTASYMTRHTWVMSAGCKRLVRYCSALVGRNARAPLGQRGPARAPACPARWAHDDHAFAAAMTLPSLLATFNAAVEWVCGSLHIPAPHKHVGDLYELALTLSVAWQRDVYDETVALCR